MAYYSVSKERYSSKKHVDGNMIFAKGNNCVPGFLIGQDICQMTLEVGKITASVQIKICYDES